MSVRVLPVVAQMTTLADVEQRLLVVLANAAGLLPQEQLDDMRDLVVHGEPGVALENLWTQLYEYDVDVRESVKQPMLELARAMGMEVPAWFA